MTEHLDNHGTPLPPAKQAAFDQHLARFEHLLDLSRELYRVTAAERPALSARLLDELLELEARHELVNIAASALSAAAAYMPDRPHVAQVVEPEDPRVL